MQSVDDLVARGVRRHPDDDPAEVCKFLEAGDVLGELDTVGSVVVPVVLGGDLQVLPAHIEVVDLATAPYRDLSRRLGKPGAADEQA